MEKKTRRGPRHNIRFMLSLARAHRKSALWFCPAQAAAGTALSAVQLFMIPVILQRVENGASVGRLAGIIVLFTVLLILFTAGGAYLRSCAGFGRVELRLTLAAMIQHKTLTTSFPNLEDPAIRGRKDRAVMLISGSQCATEQIWTTLTELMKNAAVFLLCLFLLSAIHPLLIAAVLASAGVSFAVGSYLNGWGHRHRDEEAGYLRHMDYLSERSRDHTMAKDVRVFGMADWLDRIFGDTLYLFRRFSARGERVCFAGDAADAVMRFLQGGVVLSFLIGAAVRGEMDAARFVLLAGAVNMFSGGVDSILGACALLRRQCLDISAVREYLDCPEPFRMEGGAPLSPDPDGAYELRLRDVSFRYPGAERDVLSHVDLTVAPEEKLAVVGLNGAGKTTLIRLLAGFLEPTQGQVLLNGTDIRTFNRPDYYRLFAAVFQDWSVLDATIAENIAQTDGEIDGERLARSVELAGLEEKLESLPQGAGTHLGQVFENGIELSGGELQRLMLARALYKDAPVLLLDEPTSALDPIAESEIYRRYDELTGGKTAVYISHRLASTRFCDRILLLADGGIAEEGTHDSLLAQGGRYAALFALQSRYYREGGEGDAQGVSADPAGL